MDAKGNTALHLACQKRHKEIVKFLFQQAQIDIHKKNKKALALKKIYFSLLGIIIHASLAEAIQVGRCNTKVASKLIELN